MAPGAASDGRARGREGGLTEQPPRASAPRGPVGPAGWGRGGDPAAAAGPAREAEKARRGQLPSGGRREVQLSSRACRRGHKWGRAGRSGAAAGGGPWRSPQTLSDARSPSRAQGRRRRRAAREPRGGGRGGSAGEDQETLALPSALAPAAVTPGLWGRMARARSLGIPGEAGAGRPASPGSGTGAGKAHPGEDGAGRPETSTPRGTEEQGCPEKVRDVDPHLGPGTAGVWGRDGPLGVRARERKQNKMPRSEEMVEGGREIKDYSPFTPSATTCHLPISSSTSLAISGVSATGEDFPQNLFDKWELNFG